MFGFGEDTRTTTLDDAALWERNRIGGYGPSDDLPTPAELREDAEMDAFNRRREAERDAAARARGEYVPTSAMRLAASVLGLTLVQRGVLGMEVTPAREGVLSISPMRSHQPLADPLAVHAALVDYYGDDAEVAMGDGVIWVRIIRTPFADPFVNAAGIAHDEPPF